ncbi:DNA-binding transcriptional LysR family regulator [Sinorhizobium fredii]
MDLGYISLAMQAAAADQGVAIGWHRMITPMLARGELMRLTDLGRIDIHASQIIVAASKAKPSKWIVRRS